MHRRFPVSIPVAALGFAAMLLVFEHFNGGVQSHHVLNRSDLPAISNWLGLLTLPVLGIALGWRAMQRPASAGQAGRSSSMLVAFVGALVYGAALAASFAFAVSTVTNTLFFALFLLAVLLPIHRAEFLLGFVVGMTFTFGGVLPFFIALIFAAISFVVRTGIGAAAALVRRARRTDTLA